MNSELHSPTSGSSLHPWVFLPFALRWLSIFSTVFGLRAVFRQTPFQLPAFRKRALVIVLASPPGTVPYSSSIASCFTVVSALSFTCLCHTASVLSSVSRLLSTPIALGQSYACFCSPFLWAMPGWGMLAPQPRWSLSSRVQTKQRACPQAKDWVSALRGHFRSV